MRIRVTPKTLVLFETILFFFFRILLLTYGLASSDHLEEFTPSAYGI